MNKRLITIIVVIIAFLGVAFVATGKSAQQVKKQNYIPTVGILQLVTHPALDEIHRGIVAGLKNKVTLATKLRSIIKMPKLIKPISKQCLKNLLTRMLI